MTDIDPHWLKGTKMAFEKDAVRRLDERTYLVKSQTKWVAISFLTNGLHVTL